MFTKVREGSRVYCRDGRLGGKVCLQDIYFMTKDMLAGGLS